MSMRKDIMLSVKQQNLLINPQTQRTVSILTRHLRAYGKYFRRLQQLSQARFVDLPGSGELIMLYWSQIVESTEHNQSDIAGAVFRANLDNLRNSDELQIPMKQCTQSGCSFKGWFFSRTACHNSRRSRGMEYPMRKVCISCPEAV